MTGPQTVHLPPRAWRRRDSLFAGTHPRLILDPTIAGADLHGGVIDLDPGATVKLHYHRRGELQFVLAGRGKLLHADGTESPVAANSAVFSPAGKSGAHGFRNSGRTRMSILFLYPSPGGRRPAVTLLKRGASQPTRPRAQPAPTKT